MNKHRNKNSVPAVPALNRKQLEIDGMPTQVALELLCAVGARMTARQRKTCWAARSKVFESTLRKKPTEAVLGNRLRRATWPQIVKWTKRNESRGALLESAYSKALQERHSLTTSSANRNEVVKFTQIQARIIILDKIIAALEMKRAHLMVFADAVRLERENREQNQRFLAGLKTVAPSIARTLKKKLGVASQGCGVLA